MKFISCNEQHNTFLLTQMEIKVFGYFSEKSYAFAMPQKELKNVEKVPVISSQPANILSMLT
jgi:hypothetical protein